MLINGLVITEALSSPKTVPVEGASGSPLNRKEVAILIRKKQTLAQILKHV